MLKHLHFIIAIAALLPLTARATVDAARPNTMLQDSGVIINGLYPYIRSDQFGVTELAGNNGVARSSIGLDSGGTPIVFIEADTKSTKTSIPSASASLTYNWEIVGAGTAPVLVHISTAGYLRYNYGFTPDRADTYNLTPNYVTAGVKAYFQTYSTDSISGVDQRSYGLQTGNYNWGIERVNPTLDFTERNGGTSTLDKSFSQSFDIWVMPNRMNYIGLQAETYLYPVTSYVRQYATEFYSIDAYIDPVITIDTQFADTYQLKVSAIPYIPSAVPEPEIISMFGSGLLLLTGLYRRRVRALTDPLPHMQSV